MPSTLHTSKVRTSARAARFGGAAVIALALDGCGSSNFRDATAPAATEAANVSVVKEPKKGCKKVGSAKGQGRDLDEKVSRDQALVAAKEGAARLGGNTIVVATETDEPEAGAGGTYQNITQTVDVYACAPSR